MSKKALGKGLGALISSSGEQSIKSSASPEIQKNSVESVRKVDLKSIIPSTLQPRREFSSDALNDLVTSIREHGVIQPLIVRENGGFFELIAGERRWRACRQIGLSYVPVIVRQASDREVLEMALIENLQRENLNPIEEAHGYARLVSEFSLKQDVIAGRVGKNRATIANAIRLLDLTSSIQAMVSSGQISVGHAKVILSVRDANSREWVAEQIVRRGLTVRRTEKLVQELKEGKTMQRTPAALNDQQKRLGKLSKYLSEQLSTAVNIQDKGTRGRIEINYKNQDELVRILELIGVEPDEFAVGKS